MAWDGTVALQPGQMSYFGTCGTIPLHSSIAIGLLVVVSGQVDLYDGDGGSARMRPGGPTVVVMPPGMSHAAAPGDDADPPEVVLAILDPDGPGGRVLGARLAAVPDTVVGPRRWVAAAEPCAGTSYRPEPDDPAGARLIDSLVARMVDSDPGPHRPIHPALRRAIDLIPGRLSGGVELRKLAAEVGLSPSRLGHLFAVELGLPYRAYVRWARLQKVIDVLRSGGTLTDAAHAAGFTDSAHLNRTSRAIFGTNPSDMVRNMRWV